ncbi:flavodoxin domain-containing protein [Sporolactobacillus putidus]|uniref:Flavodoxin n=1 Tax=Sporolactobacillus putidus TaxID=492735 RepID=A0A917S4G5_9BACL|nr:flavodoxin domain-containing protein [Sporolactobacillus putidus]GGL54828.1 flavodoxin [Sporolactobacillus putidus]
MKTILIYATKYGNAAETAQRIKTAIGEDIECFNIMTGPVPSLENFGTVILGGSIYMGKVQKQLTAYMNSHLEQLLRKNIGLFLCAGEPDEAARSKELQNAFPEALYRHAAAKDVLGFAFNFEKMRFFDKLIMRKIKGDSISTGKFYEDRISLFVNAVEQAGPVDSPVKNNE